ncbi:MAG: heme-binding protein [Gammaproteobacteria bacterium]
MKLSHVKNNIHWESAYKAIEAAQKHASKLNVPITVAIVDSGGNLMSLLRSNDGPYLSINIAIDKAYTAASFSVSTSDWKDILPKDSMLRDSILNRDRFVAFGGGIPIMLDGECIGAIGVSGASEEQDEECAQAGLNAIIN